MNTADRTPEGPLVLVHDHVRHLTIGAFLFEKASGVHGAHFIRPITLT